nr:MAG TPA: hypothetical protein [Caudoviricetes sp.]
MAHQMIAVINIRKSASSILILITAIAWLNCC